MSWPGTRPIHGDQVHVVTGSGVMVFTGDIQSVGVRRDGHGFVELTLPDADPQQRRVLGGAKEFEYRMYRGGTMVYQSPALTVRQAHRNETGALVVTASP
ncbi:hypothetical protein [Streptomyces sp. GS7]|uniref:hypothetical protein n=1 Tax=Streptomyces sp. GS7 TaxID=2692234 RepID=UPI001317F329|nr:hypothetical protein [Streptomyces sp. GS7]QHC26407.1 hypothetical protein GR130_38595 [Streptomyces sp. GS7]